jgi:two-component system alkaline phosphatase synthesis response regulator PhoP
MKQRRVLVVEDDPGMAMALTDCLTSEGYHVDSEVDGEAGLARALIETFDLLVLDLMLPNRNGFDICRELRHAGDKTPILILSARGQTVDKVVGLKLGADDYLTKPFEIAELLARLEALLRRVPSTALSPKDTYLFSNICVDFPRTAVYRNGAQLELSAREFKLLRYFIERRGLTISRDELLNEVWGYDSTPTTRTVDVHVAQLRQKIESDPHNPQWLVTVYGFGYKFMG